MDAAIPQNRQIVRNFFRRILATGGSGQLTISSSGIFGCAKKDRRWPVENIHLIFPYTVWVWNLPQPWLCDFAVRCKECGETVPAPVGTMPETWIVAKCPLCDDRRRYPPSDIYRGKLSHKLRADHVRS
jgi:hypothetical protein